MFDSDERGDPTEVGGGADFASTEEAELARARARMHYVNIPDPQILPDGWANQLPGPGLAGLLAHLQPRRITSLEASEAVAAWQRIMSWAQAEQAKMITELAARPEMAPERSDRIGSVTAEAVTGLELAGSMSTTTRQAEYLVNDSLVLVNDFAATCQALAEGRIDRRRARVITEELRHRDADVRRAVEEAVLDRAQHQDTTQLRRAVKRMLHRLAPESEAAKKANAKQRRFVRIRPAEDGMAWLEAFLSAEEAQAVKATLDAGAAELKRRDRADREQDPTVAVRTLDQGRADVLALLAWSALAAQRIAAHGSCACGETTPESAFGASSVLPLPSEQGRPVSVHITLPLSAVLGVSDEPGELSGYGPIPAEVGRALAAGGVWRRLVTDPVSGTILDVGTTTYAPPQGLRDHIMMRDRECIAPGCYQPAWRCEIDHTREFPHGPTAHHNLGVLCKHHHMVKHHSEWCVVQVIPGVFQWTSPTGRVINTRDLVPNPSEGAEEPPP